MRTSVLLAISIGLLLTLYFSHYQVRGLTSLYSRSESVARRKPVDGVEKSIPVNPYPRGRWRLAREKLNTTLLNISVILVTHTQSTFERENYPLHIPSPTSRGRISRSKAISLANEIYAKVSKNPAEFSAYAIKYSDDLTLVENGGSLGMVRADMLPAVMLDAISSLEYGEVSRPIETKRGLIITKFDSPPPRERVAASRVVISYLGADGKNLRRGIERSKEEAYRLAVEIMKRARANPPFFGDLVQRYSDHADVITRGSIGVIDNYRPSNWGYAFAIIRDIEVGGITQPVDTRIGYQVFLREPLKKIRRYSGKEIAVFFREGSVPREGKSRADARAKMKEVLENINNGSVAFEEISARAYDTKRRFEFESGRETPEIELALDQVEVGNVVAHPVEICREECARGRVSIIKKAAPTEYEKDDDIRFSLPSPNAPDIDFIVSNATDGAALASYMREIRGLVKPAVLLAGERGRRLEKVFEDLEEVFEKGTGEERLEAMRRARVEIKKVAGESAYDYIDGKAKEYAAEWAMSIPHYSE